jgi:hypothetical protein
VIGAGAVAATSPALRVFGFPDTDPSGKALARLAGERDIALGLLVVAMRDHGAAFRAAGLASAGVDAADAVSLTVAALRQAEIRLAALLGAVSGGAAAIAGLWAVRRL